MTALPLRELILGALAGTAVNLRAQIGYCAGCEGGPCPDHRDDLALAGEYDAAYMQVAAGGSEWATLALSLAAGVN